jgi:tubulin alpha
MPREVVTVAVGQCGVQLVKEMWGLLASEHELDLTGHRLNYRSHVPTTMYAESDGDFFIPRCCLIDSENSVIDAIRYGAMKDTFDPMHIINGNECASNCFARGKFIVMQKKHEEVVNSVRQQLEGCNSIACILMTSSSGGGTGSGYGVHLLEHLHDEHSKIKRNSITVLPSRTLSTSTVEPYNAMMAASAMLDGTELTVNIQNEALYNICNFKSPLYSEAITYCHLNQLIAQIFSSMTVSIRSPGNLHVDLSEFNTNLVPFPRISNVLASISPVRPKSLRPIHPNTNTITTNSFSKKALVAIHNYTDSMILDILFSKILLFFASSLLKV